MESRLNELEAKMNLAENLLDALNRTVFRQQVRALSQQLQDAEASESTRMVDETPPHY